MCAELATNSDRKTASDLEALLYFNTASMAGPFSSQGYRTYFHLMHNYLRSKGWTFDTALPFLKDYPTLSEYDRQELDRLKRWIFQQQKKYRCRK